MKIVICLALFVTVTLGHAILIIVSLWIFYYTLLKIFVKLGCDLFLFLFFKTSVVFLFALMFYVSGFYIFVSLWYKPIFLQVTYIFKST